MSDDQQQKLARDSSLLAMEKQLEQLLRLQ
jgi:hypothetical protein